MSVKASAGAKTTINQLETSESGILKRRGVGRPLVLIAYYEASKKRYSYGKDTYYQ